MRSDLSSEDQQQHLTTSLQSLAQRLTSTGYIPTIRFFLTPKWAVKGNHGPDTASKAGKSGRPVLLSFDEMPEWFRRESNKWVLHGYRPISGSA